MSLLLNGEMTEDEGFTLEAADQCGFENTDDDCEYVRGSTKSVVLFAKVMLATGIQYAKTALEAEHPIAAGELEPELDEITAIVAPLIEQERQERLADYKRRPIDPKTGRRFHGISSDSIIDEVLTLGSGDPEAALELLVEWRAGLA